MLKDSMPFVRESVGGGGDYFLFVILTVKCLKVQTGIFAVQNARNCLDISGCEIVAIFVQVSKKRLTNEVQLGRVKALL